MSSKTTYRRLPGRARKRFGIFNYDRHQLWIAEDHLLFLRMRPYSERAKRFYFEDIQALTVCPTGAGRVLNVFLGVAAVFMLFIAIFDWTGSQTWLLYFFGAIGAILGGCAALNTLFGPTCATHLITAVQTQRIYCLGRERTAMRVTGDLLPIIQTAQGGMSGEELQRYRQQRRAQEEADEAPATPPQRVR